MALMLCFSDYDATGFLDSAAGRLATSDLLDQCVNHVLDHAGKPFPSTLKCRVQAALEHQHNDLSICTFLAHHELGSIHDDCSYNNMHCGAHVANDSFAASTTICASHIG